ncbi:outer membrane protein assembly factor BamB family protein [Sunxiuqinia sp. A32]|uniref:outer membrane protein assembly factor BamB family protein n=1 Tax=Sunxiuqinia sp. A32 TaxID=3461496 RepID=UPI0040463C44
MKKYLLIGLILFFTPSLFAQNEWLTFRGDRQLTASVSNKLPGNLKLLFSFPTGDDIKASPVVKNDVIYCGSTDGSFYAINFDGKLKWKYNAENAIEAPAIIIDDAVIFGILDGWLINLNADSGNLIWKYETDNQIIGSANWNEVDGQKVLAVGSYDYYLHGVDLTDGTNLWKYESDNFINGAPALWENNVVFGGCDGYLHVVDLETGEAIRKINIETYVASSPAIVDDFAYVGDYEGQFFCVNLEEGKIEWTYDNEEKNLPFISSAAVSKDKIVIGNEDRNLYCFDRKTGEKIWDKRLTNRINSSSVIADKKIVTATMDGMLFIHNLEDGSEVWKYEIGSQIVSSPALYKGKIIIGANDGRIYVFGE